MQARREDSNAGAAQSAPKQAAPKSKIRKSALNLSLDGPVKSQPGNPPAPAPKPVSASKPALDIDLDSDGGNLERDYFRFKYKMAERRERIPEEKMVAAFWQWRENPELKWRGNLGFISDEEYEKYLAEEDADWQRALQEQGADAKESYS